METLTFTPAEAFLIAHRLEAPDAIAEVLVDRDVEWTFDQIQDRAEELLSKWSEGQRLTVDLSDALTAAVIQDCCDGSVIINILSDMANDGEISRGKFASYVKAAHSITDKTGWTFNLD